MEAWSRRLRGPVAGGRPRRPSKIGRLGMRHQTTVNSDGTVTIDGLHVPIPNVHIDKLIGSGANGVVFRARHVLLNRDLAVKVWLSAREDDQRDKFVQGIEEARKMAGMDPGRRAIRIYDAGTAGALFYATMDYYPGITLTEWLRVYTPGLMVRLELAKALTDEVFYMTSDTTFHGDLHANNVLISTEAGAHSASRGVTVRGRPDPLDPNTEAEAHYSSPEFVVIDFGTSRFTSREYSLRRHWRVFNETILRVLTPLNVNRLWGHRKPQSSDCREIYHWYRGFFGEVTSMLASLGIEWDEYFDCSWYDGLSDRDKERWETGGFTTPPAAYPDERVRRELVRLVSSGLLRIEML